MEQISRASIGVIGLLLLLPYYWSSTTYPNGPQSAWVVRIFQDGYQDRSKKTDTGLVIAVRGEE